MCIQTSGLPLTYRGSSRSFALTLLVLSMPGPFSGCMDMNSPPVVAPPPVGSSPEAHVAAPQRTGSAKTKRPAPPETRTSETELSARAASIDPQSLLGLDPDGVQKRLGSPGRIEDRALSREWVYAARDCSFSIYFYPNVNSTSLQALKYGSSKTRGKAIESSDACVRKILTARKNADK